MSKEKFNFENVDPEQQSELLELYRQNLGYSMENLARGDTSPKVRNDIENANQAISELMRLLGLQRSSNTTSLQLLIESDPPGAEVQVDNQVLEGQITPCFIEVGPGRHKIEAALDEHRPSGRYPVICSVTKLDGGLKLQFERRSGVYEDAEQPRVSIRFQRRDAAFIVNTKPPIPQAQILLSGLNEHNRSETRWLTTNDAGRLQWPDPTPEAILDGSAAGPAIPSGDYLLEGRWESVFGIFNSVSQPASRIVRLTDDTTRQPLDVAFRLSVPLALWRMIIMSQPVTWLRNTAWAKRFRDSPTPVRRRKVGLAALMVALLAPLLWLFSDWLETSAPRDGMLRVQYSGMPPLHFDDHISNNLRDWLGDTISPVRGDVLASIALAGDLDRVKRFALDRYETSIEEYKNFLDFRREHVGDEKDFEPFGVDRWEEFDDLPVVGLSWNAAQAYCNWRGKRLPTGAEWQAAAGSPDEESGHGTLFPWGNTFDSNRCNIVESSFSGLLPTRSAYLCPTEDDGADLDQPQACWSASGLCSMVGNAGEWVDEPRTAATMLGAQPTVSDGRMITSAFALSRRQPVMGGSFLDSGRINGMTFARAYHDPEIGLPHIGVRCARDLARTEAPADDMVAIGPYEKSLSGAPTLVYAMSLQHLTTDSAAKTFGETLRLVLANDDQEPIVPFDIDVLPVSIREYQEFIRITRGRRGAWSHPRQPTEKQSHDLGDMPGGLDSPVASADWWDAYAYCNWRGKRLPRFVELQYAYSGGTDTAYPWGDVFSNDELLNYESPIGIEGLVSRRSEWTQNFYRSRFLDAENLRVQRPPILSAESIKPLMALSAARFYSAMDSLNGSFRCAVTIQPPVISTLFGTLDR